MSECVSAISAIKISFLMPASLLCSCKERPAKASVCPLTMSSCPYSRIANFSAWHQWLQCKTNRRKSCELCHSSKIQIALVPFKCPCFKWQITSSSWVPRPEISLMMKRNRSPKTGTVTQLLHMHWRVPVWVVTHGETCDGHYAGAGDLQREELTTKESSNGQAVRDEKRYC